MNGTGLRPGGSSWWTMSAVYTKLSYDSCSTGRRCYYDPNDNNIIFCNQHSRQGPASDVGLFARSSLDYPIGCSPVSPGHAPFCARVFVLSQLPSIAYRCSGWLLCWVYSGDRNAAWLRICGQEMDMLCVCMEDKAYNKLWLTDMLLRLQGSILSENNLPNLSSTPNSLLLLRLSLPNSVSCKEMQAFPGVVGPWELVLRKDISFIYFRSTALYWGLFHSLSRPQAVLCSCERSKVACLENASCVACVYFPCFFLPFQLEARRKLPSSYHYGCSKQVCCEHG